MKDTHIIRARREAESAVADMTDGPLKVAAFQTILASLLAGSVAAVSPSGAFKQAKPKITASGRGTTSRLMALVDDGCFNEQRLLTEIQQALAERGFHYKQSDLGTPLARLVQTKVLRRVHVTVDGKRVWKYSLY